MEYVSSNLAQTLVVLGLLLLAIEVLVLGLSTFVLFFIGIGTITTGILMWIGLLPETVPNALLATAIISTVFALVFWQPMKRIQNKIEVNQIDNDMIGHRFLLNTDLPVGQTITHRYSGINWQVRATTPLSAGTEVQITSMEVGLLTVERVG
jgi:membrane protein implicated in regulation of membrane protease activity